MNDATHVRLLPKASVMTPTPKRPRPDLEADVEESRRLLINARLVDEAVRRCETGVLVVECDESDFRERLPSLYNELWDAALVHDKLKLDCRVVPTSSSSSSSSSTSPTNRERVIDVDSLPSEVLKYERELVNFVLYDNPSHALPPPERLRRVALGGTFDRLHNGHKKLLTIAIDAASEEVVVGVTSESMLAAKRNAEKIQPLAIRLRGVEDFCASILAVRREKSARPRMRIVVIDDPWGPTVGEREIDAVVVSSETLKGAAAINDLRREKGWPPLLPVVVMRSNVYTLSSTFIRDRL